MIPVRWSKQFSAWMFSDYKQVSELINHPLFTANIAVDTATINPDNSASQNVYRSKITR